MMSEKRSLILAAASRTNLIPFIEPELQKLDPLDVMIIATQVLMQEGDWRGAAAIAKETTPYFHARRASIEVKHEVSTTIHELSLEELEAEYQAALAHVITIEPDGE